MPNSILRNAATSTAAMLLLCACSQSAPPSIATGTPSPSTTGYELAPWQVQEGALVGASTIELPIVYTTGGCGFSTAKQRWDHASIVSTSSAVTITVFLRNPPIPTSKPGGPLAACPAIAATVRRTIALPQPLGARTLFDGSFTPSRPVTR